MLSISLLLLNIGLIYLVLYPQVRKILHPWIRSKVPQESTDQIQPTVSELTDEQMNIFAAALFEMISDGWRPRLRGNRVTWYHYSELVSSQKVNTEEYNRELSTQKFIQKGQEALATRLLMRQFEKQAKDMLRQQRNGPPDWR